jgi:hypothetical protein
MKMIVLIASILLAGVAVAATLRRPQMQPQKISPNAQKKPQPISKKV